MVLGSCIFLNCISPEYIKEANLENLNLAYVTYRNAMPILKLYFMFSEFG